MKNKIGYLIIGMLLGAIITTSIFLVQIKKIKEEQTENKINGNQKMMQMRNDEMEEPPEKPEVDDLENKTERKNPREGNTTLENKM